MDNPLNELEGARAFPEPVRRLRVLVCDDDIYPELDGGWRFDMLLAQEQELLEGLYDLIPVPNVTEARERIRDAEPEVAAAYDLVIVDLFFPDEDGRIREQGSEFVDWLLGSHPDLPVLVWSGGSAQAQKFLEGHRDLFERQAVRCITKSELRTGAGKVGGTGIWPLIYQIHDTVGEGRRRRDAYLARLLAVASALTRALGPTRRDMEQSLRQLGLDSNAIDLLARRYGIGGAPDIDDFMEVDMGRATLLFQMAFLAELAERAPYQNPSAPTTWLAEKVTGRRGKAALNAYRNLLVRVGRNLEELSRGPLE